MSKPCCPINGIKSTRLLRASMVIVVCIFVCGPVLIIKTNHARYGNMAAIQVAWNISKYWEGNRLVSSSLLCTVRTFNDTRENGY